MIRFHYHRLASSRRFGPMVVPAGTRACHVYSASSVEELLAWAKKHGIPRHWLHHFRSGFPHLDLWGSALAECGEGVSDRQLAEDNEYWVAEVAHVVRGALLGAKASIIWHQ